MSILFQLHASLDPCAASCISFPWLSSFGAISQAFVPWFAIAHSFQLDPHIIMLGYRLPVGRPPIAVPWFQVVAMLKLISVPWYGLTSGTPHVFYPWFSLVSTASHVAIPWFRLMSVVPQAFYPWYTLSMLFLNGQLLASITAPNAFVPWY